MMSDRSIADFAHIQGFLSPIEQRELVRAVYAITPGFYTPRTRWGRPMSVRMLCLGHHWSARDYKYHPTRTDADGLPCPPIPDLLQQLALRAVRQSQYAQATSVRPFDICVVNFYPEATGKMGDHVDNSESPEALASGYPVVSLSVGASCVFRMGGMARKDPYTKHTLASGDLVWFGGSRRLAYHGVARVLKGTMPGELGLPELGRLNLTFRIR